MPPPTLTSLQIRIRQLEDDNVSLSHAASEAAALAEEYAADASAYRRLRPADQALVTELTDATRRKDRRIQRLSSLLEAERARVEGLERRVAELEEMLQVADEMECVLQMSLNLIEKERCEGGGHEKIEERKEDGGGVSEVLVKALKEYFPEGIVGEDFMAFEALKAGLTVLEMMKGLHPNFGKSIPAWGPDFLAALEESCHAVESVLRWCFEEPEGRGVCVLEFVTALQERLSAVAKDVENEETTRWTEDFANMRTGLLRMGIETVVGITSRRFVGLRSVGGVDALLKDVRVALERRASEVRARLKALSTGGDLKDVEDLKAKLDTTSSMLNRKTRELEDLRVRMNVFEERISTALEESKELGLLRTRVTELEAELNHERTAHSDCRNVGPLPLEDSVNLKSAPMNGIANDHMHLEDVDNTKEAARLRRILARRHLADLQPLSFNVNSYRHESKEEAELYKSMRRALEQARFSASNSAAVELDAETLEPRTKHRAQTPIHNAVS